MPKGRHNNHKGGRKSKVLCTCTLKKKCKKCIGKDWYKKHREEHIIRRMERYYQNKNYNEEKLEQRLVEKFKEKGWD